MTKIRKINPTKTTKEYKKLLTKSLLNGIHLPKLKRKAIWKITSLLKKLGKAPTGRSAKLK